MARLYGIAQCSTVKKARAWLAAHGHTVPFHDFKKEGVDPVRLHDWLQQVSWEQLLNRRGTTWRRLPADVQAGIVDVSSAARLMQEQPSIIKRPVLEIDDRISLGFDEAVYMRLLFPTK